jgi:hypothetical protein
MSKFQRLVRFEDSQGQVHYGELGSIQVEDSSFTGLEVATFEGATPWSEEFHLTGRKAKIVKVCMPFSNAKASEG